MEFITPTNIYWLTRLDGIIGFSISLLVFGILGIIIGFIFWTALSSTTNTDINDIHLCKFMKRVFLTSLIPFFLGLFGLIFIPNTKEICAIYGIPAIVNNSQVQSIGTNTLNIAEIGVQYLKEKLIEKHNK